MTSPPRWAPLATIAAAVVAVAAVLALGWVLHGMPASHWSTWGANPGGARHLRAALGIGGPSLDEASFSRAMRLALAVAWLGYAAALLAASASPSLPRRGVVAAVAGVAGAVAVVLPPALSCDVYSYVGYGRLPVVHGLDPYLHGRQALAAVGDPVAGFLQWDFPSPYGPLWTVVSMAVVAPLAGSLVWQVLAFKVLGAAALVGLAHGGGELADRIAPGRGALASLAIGLNPLFLVEGPGSGHNDLTMLLGLVAGACLLARGRPHAGAALVGLSVAIKLVTVLAIPWLVIERYRAAGGKRALATAALAVAPTLLFGALFWSPGALGGLVGHASAHRPGVAASVLVAAVYALASVWVYRTSDWHTAWIATSLALAVLGLALAALGIERVWYPWYLTWPLAFALTRWQSRRAVSLSIAGLTLALMAMSSY